MPRIVGFIFGAIAGLLAAAWLYGGSTWDPGFAAKGETRKADAPQFKLSSAPPASTAAVTPPKKAPDETPPSSTETTPSAPPAPAFNTGGNANVDAGAGPNWGLGFRLGQTTTGLNTDKNGDRPK